MRWRNSNQAFRRFVGVLAGLNLLVAAGEPARVAEDFVVVNDPVDIPERGKVSGYCIMADGHRFSFIPPLQWRMESNRSEKSITFTRRALDTAIRIRLLPPDLAGKEADEERWQRLVMARYPEAEIIRRFVCHTGTCSGMAFDLRQDFGRNLQLESRVAFVSYGKGVVEIGQTGLKGGKETGYEDFGTLLTSLRINAQTPEKK